MSMDRYITWGELPEWGAPTTERIMAVLAEFLGRGWMVWASEHDSNWICCESVQFVTFPLLPERSPGDPGMKRDEIRPLLPELRRSFAGGDRRGFEVVFNENASGGRTRVVTRGADPFTRALADEFTRIIARWWNGEVEWPE